MAAGIFSLKRLCCSAISTRYIITKEVWLHYRRLGTMSTALEKVSDVAIDDSGTFKYILICVEDKTSSTKKSIVRGYARCQWHSDIFDETTAQLGEFRELKAKCLGGGRIQHDPDQKAIKVYGYSQGFGKANHKVSVEILKRKYPDYNITWSDEGY